MVEFLNVETWLVQIWWLNKYIFMEYFHTNMMYPKAFADTQISTSLLKMGDYKMGL